MKLRILSMAGITIALFLLMPSPAYSQPLSSWMAPRDPQAGPRLAARATLASLELIEALPVPIRMLFPLLTLFGLGIAFVPRRSRRQSPRLQRPPPPAAVFDAYWTSEGWKNQRRGFSNRTMRVKGGTRISTLTSRRP